MSEHLPVPSEREWTPEEREEFYASCPPWYVAGQRTKLEIEMDRDLQQEKKSRMAAFKHGEAKKRRMLEADVIAKAKVFARCSLYAKMPIPDDTQKSISDLLVAVTELRMHEEGITAQDVYEAREERL